MHGLFSIPLNLFVSMMAPPDPASLQQLEKGLDRIAREYELSDRETRTLKDSFVEPFRQEGMPLGPDTVEWLQILNRRLHGLPPGAVSAGALLQWNTLDLHKYARGVTLEQYLDDIAITEEGKAPLAVPAPAAPKRPRKSTTKKRAAKKT